MDEKRGIGKNNDLLFRIPEDFKRMKALTSGHPIIMGRKTFESIGRPLPNRTNIIVTRDTSYKKEGTIVVHSLKEAIKKSAFYCHPELGSGSRSSRTEMPKSVRQAQDPECIEGRVRHDKRCEVFIFGGGQIFAEALPLVDKLYLTIVDGNFDADTFFPDYPEFKKVVFEQKGNSGDYIYRFIDLERV